MEQISVPEDSFAPFILLPFVYYLDSALIEEKMETVSIHHRSSLAIE